MDSGADALPASAAPGAKEWAFGRAARAAQDRHIVNLNPLSRHVALLSAAAAALAMADARCGTALAQGRLDASYSVTLGGLPIGRGSWVIDIGEDHYSAAATGATAGIMRAFTSGQGQSSVRGNVSGGNLAPVSYASSIYTDKKYDEVRMLLHGGNVKDFVAEPANTPNASRIPITEAHRRGVSDPMTAPLVKVPGGGDVVVPQACQRTLSIFDGRMRYDLQLSFKRMESVAAQAGYKGPAVVCAVRFSPIAGHVPDRYAIKYLVEAQDIEMWLAPIAGTRLMAPYRVSFATPIGMGILQATQFVSNPQPGKASAKTQ